MWDRVGRGAGGTGYMGSKHADTGRVLWATHRRSSCGRGDVPGSKRRMSKSVLVCLCLAVRPRARPCFSALRFPAAFYFYPSPATLSILAPTFPSYSSSYTPRFTPLRDGAPQPVIPFSAVHSPFLSPMLHFLLRASSPSHIQISKRPHVPHPPSPNTNLDLNGRPFSAVRHFSLTPSASPTSLHAAPC